MDESPRTFPRLPLLALTLLTMAAFAANSVLCRLALEETATDPASFTFLRLAAGALMLGALMRRRGGKGSPGSWPAAIALFLYAAGFSFAYLVLPTGTGALILFGAVQLTMTGAGLAAGERLDRSQSCGLLLALGGLAYLLRPGLSAPSPGGAAMMLAAGMAWGVYSLLGRRTRDPLAATAGNFLRALLPAALLCLLFLPRLQADPAGFIYALLSGALASGLGYVLWYRLLPSLRAVDAATGQLSVPILAALGGVFFLDEPITLRLLFASAMVLGGIALVCRPAAAR